MEVFNEKIMVNIVTNPKEELEAKYKMKIKECLCSQTKPEANKNDEKADAEESTEGKSEFVRKEEKAYPEIEKVLCTKVAAIIFITEEIMSMKKLQPYYSPTSH